MGCGGSKANDSPLVILCKERKELIKAASDHRYALAAAHVSYFHSLKDVGESIRRFVDEQLVIASSTSPGSPVLTLPSQEGKSKKKSKSSSPSSSISHSIDSSGHKKNKEEEEEIEDSHLQLSSHSEDSDLDSDSGHIHHHHHDHHDSPEEEEREEPSTSYNFNEYPPQGNWGYSYPGNNPYPYPYPYPYPDSNSYPNTYYMKKSATPAKTVVYEDPSVNGFWGSGFYGSGGYFGYSMGGPPQREPSPQRPPPEPPSPPRVSTWDFLNVFETIDGDAGGYPGYSSGRYGYGSTNSSPDSKEVREREGIPDLEDETEQEMIKDVHKEKKKINEEMNVNSKSNLNEEMKKNYGEGTSKSVPINSSSVSTESLKDKGLMSSISPDTFHSPGSIVSKSPDEDSVRRKRVSFEVEEAHTMAMDLESSNPSSLTTLSSHGIKDLQEVVKEIRDEFENASSHGKEVAVMLEVSKLPYQRRSTPLKVIFSRILYLVSSYPPARPVQVSSRTMKMAKAYSGEPGNEFNLKLRNLSSTLEEIYAWEKKLYKEVKDEERLRVIYEKECKRLRILDDRGAESAKIDAARASIRKLLTKIDVCVRGIDAIASKIHGLRDKELQPQITELIHGLTKMWKSMLRCHQKQFQAIMESKVRSLKANTGVLGDSGTKATIDLAMELVNWCSRFKSWINTQKSYIESLNEWLVRCLLPEREETPDGPAPFSPGRIGAPPIFVICNDWCQAMVGISGKEVEKAMLDFASSLQQLWERQDQEQRHRIKAEHLRKDFEKQLRTLRLERGKMEQEQGALSDKAMPKFPSESGVSRLDDLKVDLDSMRKKLEEERARHKEAAKLVHAAASTSLQAGLGPIFESLGIFTSEVLKAHEHVRLVNPGGS